MSKKFPLISNEFLVFSRFLGIVMLFLSLKGSLNAQSRKEDKIMDSLTGIVLRMPDTVKLEIYSKIANSYGRTGEESEKYAKEGLQLAKQLNNRHYILVFLHTLGNIGCNESNLSKALSYYLDEIKVLQSWGADSSKMTSAFRGLGNVYLEQDNYDKALEYYQKDLSLILKRKSTNHAPEGGLYQSIAAAYTAQGRYGDALTYLFKELSIWVDLKQGTGYESGNNYLLIGEVYYYKKEYDLALNYCKKAIIEFHKNGSMAENVGDVYNSMGKCYLAKKSYSAAISSFNSAAKLVEGTQSNGVMAECFEGLAEAYSQTGQYLLAYEYSRRYSDLKDTIVNVENRKQMNEMEAKYESANKDKELIKKDAEIQNQVAEAKTKDAESKRQRATIILFAFVAFAIGIIAIIILRSLRISRKQKSLIELQKKEVEAQKGLIEEKNKDILDSITYARRLQDAILPPRLLIEEYMPESFIMYKPKDIVAGDFYWIERAENNIFIAACDCTGHGVPGAMVSIVCSNALNRCLKEFRLDDPGAILDKARELVIENFGKSENEVKDGMDISLCSVNTHTRELKWSGAYNPLWFVHNNEWKELIPDKQPIGRSDNPRPFTTHRINLSKGDSVYLFTDGYADQFGGPKGKKFKYKQLEQMLVANCKLPMNEQKKLLDRAFEEWKGNMEQTDDVCVIGIRL